ncbi:response regulator [Streptomyces sp. NPDC048644]|uniref:response regulator n=1 Tax=Streptomyces sp. NPDC048644 TaxID=3365582 RepID=UPI00371405EB
MAAVTARIGVAVVDDDALVRLALTTMLGGLPDIEIVGEATDGAEAKALAAEYAPDVVLLDLNMPGTDGLRAAATLAAGPAAPAVPVLTAFDTDENVLAALRAGACGFIAKHTPPPDIVTAIRQAAAGDPVLSPNALRGLIRQVTTPEGHDARRRARALLDRLTERERAVAGCVAQGSTNAQIAAELHLSTAGVKLHLSRTLAKLGVGNRTQLALLVHDAR